MRVTVAPQTGGGIQFILHSENQGDEAILSLFVVQCREKGIHMHGCVYSDCGVNNSHLGPTSVNVGSPYLKSEE